MLNADELRAFWPACEKWDHPFSLLLRYILLTATRREEAAGMRWCELEGTTWTIPAVRYKTKIDFEVPLSRPALDLLDTVKKLSDDGLVFTTSGKTRMGGFSKFKARFDQRMLDELRHVAVQRGDDPAKVVLNRWTVHDLRRTARSLMTQAGVLTDHAERALGHIIGGIRGVYDRHGYFEEKQRAFEALAAQIERALNPRSNVIPIHRGADTA